MRSLGRLPPRAQLADHRVTLVVRKEGADRREDDALLGVERGLEVCAEVHGCGGERGVRRHVAWIHAE
jgi:hypothetical protein